MIKELSDLFSDVSYSVNDSC